MSKISRRDFLKGSVLGAAGVAGAGLLSACSAGGASAPAPESSAPAVSGEAEAGVKTEEEIAKEAFEQATEPIEPAKAPAVWDYEADVIIVGTGAGGLNAALRLREAGMSVIVLDKLIATGGSSRCGGFFVNLGGHRQANEAKWAWPEYPYNVDKIVEKLNNDFNQLSTDPKLLRAMVEEGPKCIDWMIDDLGIKWIPSSADPSGNYALYEEGAITKYNSINICNHVFEVLTQKTLDAGAEIHTKTEAKALVMDEGRCVGVKAAHNDKDVYYHGKKAVFLMAGGFEMNRAMLQKYVPYLANGIANCACPGYNFGECIRMGQGCGADLSGYGSVATFDGGVWWNEYDQYETDMESHVNKDGNQAVRQPWLRINQMGDRVPYFAALGDAYPYRTSGSTAGTALADGGVIESIQPGGGVFVCFDSKYEELCKENYFKQAICRVAKIIPEDDPLIDRVPPFQRDWRIGFDKMVEAGAIKKCDTIEELEEAMGLRKGVLTDNVAKWNEACEKGEDYVDNYKYDPSWLLPIDQPPYYGAKIGGHIFATKCGLRINKDMEVIDKQGAVIPGLYAGWHTAGGANGEFNLAGRPYNGLYGDLGQSFVGGFMAANALIRKE